LLFSTAKLVQLLDHTGIVLSFILAMHVSKSWQLKVGNVSLEIHSHKQLVHVSVRKWQLQGLKQSLYNIGAL